jgi:hypothetical protein
VSFGAQSATSFTVLSDTQLTATAPAEAAGTVDVTVTTPGGTSLTGNSDRFTFLGGAPAVTGLSQSGGATSGDGIVALSGSNLMWPGESTSEVAVYFGSTRAAVEQLLPPYALGVYAPAGVAGTVDVTVRTPMGTSAVTTADQYTYYAPPTVTSVSPNTGAAGTSVVITGTNLTGATWVHFGSAAATGFTVVSNTEITVPTPAVTGTSSAVDVTVTTPGGTSSTSLADHYTLIPVPSVTGVSPAAGPPAGGTSVTITGSGFTGASGVTFGTVAATSFTVVSDTQIHATTPAGSSGTVNVTITTPGGTSASNAAAEFTYFSPVTVAPNVGPTTGRTSVTISGAYPGATGVLFGGVPATSVSIYSTAIYAQSPPGTGTVDVTVVGTGWSTPVGATDRFTYAPTGVTSLSLTSGAQPGGNTVYVYGFGFTGATNVTFGATSAESFSVVSPSAIAAVVPPGTGTVDVQVTTPMGTTPLLAADRYTYVAPLVLRMTPTSGSVAGGIKVAITGSGFFDVTGVDFGTTPATSVTVTSSKAVTAVAPPGSAGTVDVTVQTKEGPSRVTLADRFTYQVPAVVRISPTYGSAVGGTTVTITGVALTGATGVTFGTTPATSVTFNSATRVTAVAPPGAPGTVDVQVVTPAGLTAATTTDRYTYWPPTVSKLSTKSGSVAGGTGVVITGKFLLGATSVDFGGTPASEVVAQSSTQIFAVSPPEAAGTVDVTVTTPAGTSPISTADQFTYQTPAVTKVSPINGPAIGGTVVTITGHALTGVTAVDFGTTPATTFTMISPTQLSATSPPHASGAVQITVTTAGGQTPVVSGDQFTFN